MHDDAHRASLFDLEFREAPGFPGGNRERFMNPVQKGLDGTGVRGGVHWGRIGGLGSDFKTSEETGLSDTVPPNLS